MTKKEFKVIKTSHLYGNIKDSNHLAYAIVVTTYLIAEPDSVVGVYIDNDNDDNLFIIATSFEDACNMLNKHVTKKFGRKIAIHD